MTNRKLGCRPAEHRPGQPHLSAMRCFCARRAPARLIRDHINPRPGMLGNDVLGDCTSAGIGNHLHATSALGGFDISVTPDNAVKFYSQSTGYVPGNPNTDNGGIEVDVLTSAARDGYSLDTQALFPIWGSADPQDLNGVRNITAGLSAAYLGVQLSKSDMWVDQGDNLAPIWDTNTPAFYGDTTLGSAGGHCLLLWDYTGTDDTDTVRLITWGTLQTATWRWVRSRIMEAHGLAWGQLHAPGSMYPTGDDWSALVDANEMYLRGGSCGHTYS